MKCDICQTSEFKKCYFECLVCPRHLLCEKCFFRRDELEGEHEWKVQEISEISKSETVKPKREKHKHEKYEDYNDYDAYDNWK